jgi:phosphatidylserine decarboxylase
VSSFLQRVAAVERLNFLVTNRIPRAAATRLVARISRSEHPVVRMLSMKLWTTFAGDLALHEAKHSSFPSVHACFTRELRAGARPVSDDPQVVVSPCDAIVGVHGAIERGEVYQAKGRRYSLEELVLDRALAERHDGGSYVTLRLTSSMYHRFHAPDDCTIDEVRFVPGDVWNVNPPALCRVDRVFCRNERAVLPLTLAGGGRVTLVPIAAILVGSLRLHFLSLPLDSDYDGPTRISCRANFERGEELGYFAHGSTIVLLGEKGTTFVEGIEEGHVIRMGEPLLRRAASSFRNVPAESHASATTP